MFFVFKQANSLTHPLSSPVLGACLSVHSCPANYDLYTALHFFKLEPGGRESSSEVLPKANLYVCVFECGGSFVLFFFLNLMHATILLGGMGCMYICMWARWGGGGEVRLGREGDHSRYHAVLDENQISVCASADFCRLLKGRDRGRSC